MFGCIAPLYEPEELRPVGGSDVSGSWWFEPRGRFFVLYIETVRFLGRSACLKYQSGLGGKIA